MRSVKTYYGAIAVLENFLDGAIADWEDGTIENTFIIENCIEAIIALCPIAVLDYADVLSRLREDKKNGRN